RRGDDEDAAGDRRVDRPALDRRRAVAGQAEVDDLRAGTDGPVDRPRLVDVREGAVGPARLDDQEARVTPEADDAGADLDCARSERRDEGAVAAVVGDVARVADDAVRAWMLPREGRRAE